MILFDGNGQGISEVFNDWLYGQPEVVQKVVQKQMDRLINILGEQSRKLLMVSIYLWVIENWERLG